MSYRVSLLLLLLLLLFVLIFGSSISAQKFTSDSLLCRSVIQNVLANDSIGYINSISPDLLVKFCDEYETQEDKEECLEMFSDQKSIVKVHSHVFSLLSEVATKYCENEQEFEVLNIQTRSSEKKGSLFHKTLDVRFRTGKGDFSLLIYSTEFKGSYYIAEPPSTTFLVE